MLENIKFQNFRGFKSLDLSGLSQITLLTGKNSAGKSSVLEGIFLLMDHSSPNTFDKIRQIRGLPNPSDITKLWEPLFNNFDTSKTIEISAYCQGKHMNLKYEKDNVPPALYKNQNILNTLITYSNYTAVYYTLRYTFSVDEITRNGHIFLNPINSSSGSLAMTIESDGNSNMKFKIPTTGIIKLESRPQPENYFELAEWLGSLDLRGEHQLIVDALKIIDPDIVDILAIVQQGLFQIYLKTRNLSFPIALAGDGMCKLLYLVSSVLSNPNSIILIDEIENGFHYSIQKSLWEKLAEAAKRSNTQIIATTHSYECIQNAVEGIAKAGMSENFSLHRIDKIGDESSSSCYSGELIKYAVDSSMEVR